MHSCYWGEESKHRLQIYSVYSEEKNGEFAWKNYGLINSVTVGLIHLVHTLENEN
jgi:hypothetical protein